MRIEPAPVPDGVLLIDKPQGWTSFQVVRRIGALVRPVKVGHTGTLDPMATGLLPLAIGEATKLTRWLSAGRKRYLARVQLGVATDSLDALGTPVERAPVPTLDRDQVQSVLQSLTGAQEQVPPMYSALHHQGRRLYELAREGIEVERPPRPVEIHSLVLTGLGPDQLEFDVTCSAGTYVRSLAAEIGLRLGTLAHLSGLRRTESGGFELDQALDPSGLDRPGLIERILDLDRVLARFVRIDVPVETARRLAQGVRLARVELDELGVPAGSGQIAWFRPKEEAPIVLIRLASAGQEPAMQILRVLRPEAAIRKNH